MVDGHEPGLAACQEGLLHRTPVDRQIRVAVQHEERAADQPQRAADGAGRPEQGRAVERPVHVQTEVVSVSNDMADVLAPVAHADNDL